jgi:cellulose synthase/poly-beta-1,6-N-acetylglucosamine synthase-like glycosyltransferase
MTNLPLISVIIPTYGREEPLRDTLEDLLKQDYPAFEVLVIDQTPTHEPQTQAYLEQLADDRRLAGFALIGPVCRVTELWSAASIRGIILFIDDDVQMPAGCLNAHARNYLRPEVGAVAGRVFDRMKLAEKGNWGGKMGRGQGGTRHPLPCLPNPSS